MSHQFEGLSPTGRSRCVDGTLDFAFKLGGGPVSGDEVCIADCVCHISTQLTCRGLVKTLESVAVLVVSHNARWLTSRNPKHHAAIAGLFCRHLTRFGHELFAELTDDVLPVRAAVFVHYRIARFLDYGLRGEQSLHKRAHLGVARAHLEVFGRVQPKRSDYCFEAPRRGRRVRMREARIRPLPRINAPRPQIHS